MKRLLHAASGLAILTSYALAQDEPLPVTIVLSDGTEAPFQIDRSVHGAFDVWYSGGVANGRSEGFLVTDEDRDQRVPRDLIARADLVDPAAETIWHFTLKDGRVVDGAVRESDAYLTIGASISSEIAKGFGPTRDARIDSRPFRSSSMNRRQGRRRPVPTTWCRLWRAALAESLPKQLRMRMPTP